MPKTKAKRTKKVSVEKLSPQALSNLVNTRFGAGTMRFANDASLKIQKVPCGILTIDFLLNGGFARGRHTEVYGTFSVGKTYTALKLIATAQKNKLECAFVDVEGTFDPEFAKLIGVKRKKLAFHRQEHGNQVVDFIEVLLRSRIYDVIVMDSIAALLPLPEYESDMESGSYGTEQAKLMSKALRKLTAANTDTVLVYINQTREAVGTIFGNRTRTSGGRAMSFYAGDRLEFNQGENITVKAKTVNPSTLDDRESQVVIGHRVLVRLDKSKTGNRPKDSTTFVFNYNLHGADELEDLLYLGRRLELIHRKGTTKSQKWWLEGYEDEVSSGRKRFKKWLKEHPAIASDLKEMILDRTKHPSQEPSND